MESFRLCICFTVILRINWMPVKDSALPWLLWICFHGLDTQEGSHQKLRAATRGVQADTAISKVTSNCVHDSLTGSLWGPNPMSKASIPILSHRVGGIYILTALLYNNSDSATDKRKHSWLHFRRIRGEDKKYALGDETELIWEVFIQRLSTDCILLSRTSGQRELGEHGV